MSESITLDLSSNIAFSARRVATSRVRRVEDVLIDWLQSAIQDLPIDMLSDDELLNVCQLTLNTTQQEELDLLSNANAEGQLVASSQTRLEELMGEYRRGWLRKSQAHTIAVKRRLLPKLSWMYRYRHAISVEIENRVRHTAQNRCGYCLIGLFGDAAASGMEVWYKKSGFAQNPDFLM